MSRFHLLAPGAHRGVVLKEEGKGERICVPPDQGLSRLREIAAAGELYFQGEKVIADLFSTYPLVCEVSWSEEEEAFLLQGCVKTATSTVYLHECDLVTMGSCPFVVKGTVLRRLSEDTDDAWLTRLKERALRLNQSEMESLLEEGAEEELAFHFTEGAQKRRRHLQEALPLLRLKDRTGAFAQLWLKYPTGRSERRERGESQGTGWEKDLLEAGFSRRFDGEIDYYCASSEAMAAVELLVQCGWRVEDWRGKPVVLPEKTLLSVEKEEGGWWLNGKVCFGGEGEATAAMAARALGLKERWLDLPNGSVALLSDEWKREAQVEPLVWGEVVGDAVRYPKSHLGLLEVYGAKREAPLLVWGEGELFQGNLRPYQRHGVEWLHGLAQEGFHGLLADEMGLGKTVEVLALLSRLPQDALTLVVAPRSLLFNWRQEASRFVPSLPVRVYHGGQRREEALPSSGIVLTSYGILRRDLSLLEKVDWQVVVLDEAHVIKNPDSQAHQAACALRASLRVALTGTPVENRLSELFSLYRFLMPQLLEGESAAFGRAGVVQDPALLRRLHQKIRPFFLRRTKEEAAPDLPPKIEQVVKVEMEEGQRAAYQGFLHSVREGLLKKVRGDGVGKHRMEVFEVLLRLRQLCCHPLLLGVEGESGKWDALVNDVATVVEEGRKVLVYSQFTTMLRYMAKVFRERGWPFVYLDGDTSDRETPVRQFQEDPTLPIFLVSLKAGGVGLNLSAADYVFLYDPWWNHAVESQAIDRAHRIGRQGPVIAKRYLVADSVEEKMEALKDAKRLMAQGLLEGEGTLSQEDLEFLIG